MWRQKITKVVQRFCWVYCTDNFIIVSVDDLKGEAAADYALVPLTFQNCERVLEFRSADRVEEYRRKVAQGEIGFFAERNRLAVGSIWTSINRSKASATFRRYMPLEPEDALIHDVVTAEHCRGMGIGPFMVGQLTRILLQEYRVRRVVVDVSTRNIPSLRMMRKLGLSPHERVLYVSTLGRLLFMRPIGQPSL